jgi:hypothetical protein
MGVRTTQTLLSSSSSVCFITAFNCSFTAAAASAAAVAAAAITVCSAHRIGANVDTCILVCSQSGTRLC